MEVNSVDLDQTGPQHQQIPEKTRVFRPILVEYMNFPRDSSLFGNLFMHKVSNLFMVGQYLGPSNQKLRNHGERKDFQNLNIIFIQQYTCNNGNYV